MKKSELIAENAELRRKLRVSEDEALEYRTKMLDGIWKYAESIKGLNETIHELNFSLQEAKSHLALVSVKQKVDEK